MSFHFRRLRIKDWLVYGGEIELAFPVFEQGRNLIIINGQNGFGKTSLLHALDFVFRGKLSKADLIDKWNENARAGREGSMEVDREFVHGGRVCKIVRGADFKPWGDTVACSPRVALFMDGEEQQAQVEDKIEQMLPRECLEFIFFDGAEISRYAQKHESNGVRESIEKVLGIPAVRNLRDDLSGLLGQLENEQEQLLGSEDDAQRMLQELDDLKSEEQSYNASRETAIEKKTALENTLKQLSVEAQGIEAVERERKELEQKQHLRADLQERSAEAERSIRAAITRSPLYLLEEPLAQIVDELRAKQSPSGRREQHSARLLVLHEILKAAKCLCDRKITEEMRRKFEGEVTRLAELLGDSGKRRQDTEGLLDLSAILHTIRSTTRDGEDLIDRRAAITTQLEEVETDIGRLRRELEGHDEVTVRELYQQMGSVEANIRQIVASIESLDKNLARVAKDREQKQRELGTLGTANERARGVTRTLEETRKVHAAVTELVDRQTEQKRQDIERGATEIFGKITNKPQEYDRIRVKENYALEVIRRDGTVIQNEKLSSGEKEVVAYSFITALNLSSVDPAPFVMDTPFGHLDSGHRRGLLQSLPKLQVQVFLLATDRDLPAAERDVLEMRILHGAPATARIT